MGAVSTAVYPPKNHPRPRNPPPKHCLKNAPNPPSKISKETTKGNQKDMCQNSGKWLVLHLTV